jgi:NADH-quinone oxidoreductase subunit E
MAKLEALVSKETIDEIDTWVNKYPVSQKQSAVMSALMAVQEEKNHLTDELMKAVADYLEMPEIAVYEVATFYSMYRLKPQGKHAIDVCTNVSCKLRGAKEVVNHLCKRLDIKVGESSKDGKFHLREVECLGACCGAPMMQIDKDYHENLTPEKIDKVLEEY